MFEASKLARALAISFRSFQLRVNLPDFSEKNNISICNADCAQEKETDGDGRRERGCVRGIACADSAPANQKGSPTAQAVVECESISLTIGGACFRRSTTQAA
jgi:hypothetical protein